MDRSSIINIAKKYLTLLKAEGIAVEKAYLYGSYSKDKATEDSDIDILIVADKFNDKDDSLFGKIWALTKNINPRIEPYIISSQKFYADDVSPLIELIKQEGIEIA